MDDEQPVVSDEVAGVAAGEAPVDLSALERVEAELQAVERALEQIDQGVYEGFAGLDGIAAPPT